MSEQFGAFGEFLEVGDTYENHRNEQKETCKNCFGCFTVTWHSVPGFIKEIQEYRCPYCQHPAGFVRASDVPGTVKIENTREKQLALREKIFKEVWTERDRQDTLYGALPRNLDFQMWLTVIAEEFGEVGRAILESDRDNYQKELIEVAASAIAAVEDYRLSRQSERLKHGQYCQVWHGEQWINGKILLSPDENHDVKGWKVFLYLGSGVEKYVLNPEHIREVEISGKEVKPKNA